MEFKRLIRKEKRKLHTLEESVRTLYRAGKTALRMKSYYNLMQQKKALKDAHRVNKKTLSGEDLKKAQINYNIQMDSIKAKQSKLLQSQKAQEKQERYDRKAEKLGKKILKQQGSGGFLSKIFNK